MGDQVVANPTKIQEAIEEAARELLVIEEQLERLRTLQERAAQLQNFIILGKTLLGTEERSGIADFPAIQSDESPLPSTLPETITEKRTVADWAKAVLEEVGHPMRAADIADILRQRSLIHGRWATEVVRAAMARGEDFERIALGVYAVREWPPVQKRWSQEAPPKHYSQRKARRSRHRPNRQYSLTNAILEILKAAHREMTPPEIESAIQQTGKPLYANSVSGTLSRLVSERRIKKTGPGKYAAITTENGTADMSSGQTVPASSDFGLSA